MRMLVSVLMVAIYWLATLGASAQTVEYIHTDALGTPVAVTSAAGTVVERSEYAPYGDLLNRPDKDEPGFTGHVEDAATGMTYMQQRYYDPQIGRFLSVDPVTAYDKGDMRFFSRYAYAHNNPYKFTDPDGRNPAAGAAIGCAVSGPACPAGAAVGAIIGTAVVIIGGIIIYNEASDDSGDSGYSEGNKNPSPKGTVKETIEGIREGKEPAAGTAGERGELQGKPGGGDADWEKVKGTPGAESNGPNNVKLPDGSNANRHGSTRPYGDGSPSGTDTIKHYPEGSKVPTTTIRYPEK